MRPEDLFDRIGEADERYVADARRKKRTWIPVSAVAATLALVLLVSALFQPWGSPFLNGDETTGRYMPSTIEPNLMYDTAILRGFALASARYPLMVQYPLAGDYDPNAHGAWIKSKYAQSAAYNAMGEDVPKDFFYRAMRTFLSGAGQENIVLSPVNIYMALAMLAETASGETRREILDVLGEESIESLRITASAVWNAHYCDDGAYTSVLASSLWLREDLTYNEITVQELVKNYYASVFQGEMGSDRYNEALRAWLNIETGGMLSDQVKGIELKPDTILAIATSVCFRARWSDVFEAENNTEEIFHGTAGDILGEFMNDESYRAYFWGERFSSVRLGFETGGAMSIVLPDEGIEINDLLSDPEVLSMLSSPWEYENRKTALVKLSIPRFDVSSQLDLVDGLKELGVTSAFDGRRADFSAITDREGVVLSKAKHGARVAIDEEGCVAAAFTLMITDGATPMGEEVELVIDRPFFFVITSEVGAPLFVGVVNNLQ